jgi:branched-chain amino acid transport system substrate-binding protein
MVVHPSYRLGARLYTRHVLRQNPNAKICILYENNDFGRDYTAGVRDVLGDKYAATVREFATDRPQGGSKPVVLW